MPVEVACLVGLVGAVGAAVAPLPRVRQDVPPQQELLVGTVEHLATHATDAAASHTLLLRRNQHHEHIHERLQRWLPVGPQCMAGMQSHDYTYSWEEKTYHEPKPAVYFGFLIQIE